MGGSAARGLPRSYVSLNRFFAMAKGSFLGVKRGKLGDAVGYNVTNSKDKEKQGWRAYQPVVSNPQTDGQIDQRVKLQAVNNLYRALKSVIGRGFENHKYGDPSRRAFLKLALSADFSSGPILSKGSTIAAPIPGVPIMYGSLPPVVAFYDADNVEFGLNLEVPENSDLATIGGISAIFIANGYQEGDQVTFVWGDFGYTLQSFAGFSDQEITPIYRVYDFYINTLDERSTISVLHTDLGQIDGHIEVGGPDFTQFDSDELVLAVSVSRNGDTSNLRSAANFAIGAAVEDSIYNLSSAEVARRKESYRKKAGTNTNWEQVPGGGGYTPVVQSAFTRAGTEFTPVSITRKNVGGQNFEVIVDDGGVQYYIGSRPSAASSEIVYLSGTGSTASVDPSDLTTANSVNVFDSANTAAGLRAWLISKGVDATVLPV